MDLLAPMHENATEAPDVPLQLRQLDLEDPLNYICFFIIYVAGSMAAAAGVGGGAVYATLGFVLFNFTRQAIPLSKVAVFGCAVSLFILHASTSVPSSITNHRNRFAYDAVMIMEPPTLLGTIYGVLVSHMCPLWLITLVMASLLTLSASKTFQKGNKLWASEDRKTHKIRTKGALYGTMETEKDVVEILQGEEWLGLRCVLSIGVCLIAIVLYTALTSNEKEDTFGIAAPCGGVEYWIVVVLTTAVCGAVSLYNIEFLVKYSTSPTLSGECAMTWSRPRARYYALLCLAAGFLSSFCGVGGSTIKGPILLEMGLHPTLAKATSQFMLLSTVASSALQFYAAGTLPLGYAVGFGIVGFIAAFSGKYGIDLYINQGGRQSVIVYLLAVYITVAVILTTGFSVDMIWKQIYPVVAWKSLWFKGLCSAQTNL